MTKTQELKEFAKKQGWKVYDGKKVNDGDIFILAVELNATVEKYEKDGKQKEFTSYAKIGQWKSGELLDGVMCKLSIYPPATISSRVSCLV